MELHSSNEPPHNGIQLLARPGVHRCMALAKDVAWVFQNWDVPINVLKLALGGKHGAEKVYILSLLSFFLPSSFLT